ncbi:MAG: sialidase family protein [Muribaculaceae bacterium]
MKLKPLLLSLVAAASLTSSRANAQTVLFDSDTTSHIFFRIPAIVANGNTLLYFTDDRSGVTDATAWGDIGSEGNISIVARRSNDLGRSWKREVEMVAKGFGSSGFDRGHGDAAVVCDRESGRMLLMCASGEVSYGRSGVKVMNDAGKLSLDLSCAQKVGRYYSDDNGKNWTGEEVTSEIYNLFPPKAPADGKADPLVYRLFFSSGRICQSSLIKHGDYYRIYSAITTNRGSLVLYSDDFGKQWYPLGGANAQPAPSGDEAKVEELPDGSVLLSCRMFGGRYFNIYNYANTTDGSGKWSNVIASTKLDGGTATKNNATNGEILIVPASDRKGNLVYLALQSTPFGQDDPNETNNVRRCNVSIYWKVLATAADYARPECFAEGWTRYQVTDKRSAYSTMILDRKGRIAFAYEDQGELLKVGSQSADVYDNTFRTISIKEITSGEYRYSNKKDHRDLFLKRR